MWQNGHLYDQSHVQAVLLDFCSHERLYVRVRQLGKEHTFHDILDTFLEIVRNLKHAE